MPLYLRDENTLRRVPLTDRQVILRARRDNLEWALDSGITAGLKKMKLSKLALKAKAHKIAGKVKEITAKQGEGARWENDVDRRSRRKNGSDNADP